MHSVATPVGKSSLAVKLGAGDTFEINTFAGGGAIAQVENIDMDSNPPVTRVSVDLMQCLLRTELLIDQHPEDTSYTIVDNCNNDAVVMSGSGYAGNFEIYCYSENLPHCQYTVEIKHSYGDEISWCCSR